MWSVVLCSFKLKKRHFNQATSFRTKSWYNMLKVRGESNTNDEGWKRVSDGWFLGAPACGHLVWIRLDCPPKKMSKSLLICVPETLPKGLTMFLILQWFKTNTCPPSNVLPAVWIKHAYNHNTKTHVYRGLHQEQTHKHCVSFSVCISYIYLKRIDSFDHMFAVTSFF